MQKHIEVIQYLLGNRADAHARNKWDQMPLLQASWQAWHQDAVVEDILLEHGADPCVKDYLGVTPLHMATWTSHAPLVQLLFSMGPEVNARADDGSTPLYIRG